MKPISISPFTWIALQLSILALAALPLFISWPVPPGIISLVQARLAESTKQLDLPDDWRRRGFSGQHATYELTLSLESIPQETWGLLLSSVNLRAQVSINGLELVHNESDFNSNTARLWFRPLLYPIPPGLLQAGSNQLTILITNNTGQGYLSKPLIGSYSALASFTSRSQLLRQSTLQIIVVAMFVVSALLLVLWSLRRRDVIYGLYGLGMMSWAVHNLNFIIVNPPLPAHYWDALSFITLGGFITATAFFIHRYLGEQHPRIERATLWFTLLGTPLLFMLPNPEFQFFSDYIWHPVIMLVGLYLYLLIYIKAWRQNNLETHLLALSGSVIVLYGAHDTLIKLSILPWDLGYMLPYSAAPILLVFSSLLVNRFAKTLDAMELVTIDLDQRVKAAAEEIQTNHIKLRDLDNKRLLSAERERVARDIHDGVGGQLIALLSLIRSGHYSAKKTEESLMQAMHDLRMVIESVDVPEGDLGTALASWRHRLEQRLPDSSIQLIWKPAEVSRLKNFGPSSILNVLRLLDEAATNVVRHSFATTLTLEYGLNNGRFFIELSDNGRGGADSNQQGRGIQNMRDRAKLLDAHLQIESGQNGTSIMLVLNTKTE